MAVAVHKPERERNGLLGAGVEMPGKMTDGWRGSRSVVGRGRMYLEEYNLDCDVGWHLSDPLCGCGGPARSDGHRPTHIS